MKSLLSTLILTFVSVALFATADRKQLTLQIAAPDGSYDQTSLYFDLGLSPTYNAAEDEAKVFNTLPGAPNIYSLTSDNVKCQLNGVSQLTQSAIVDIGVLIDSNTLYTFKLTQLNNFDSTTLVILEDRKLNVFTEMQANFYQVLLTPQDTTGRFFLHITSAVQLSTVTAGCSNNNGAISISGDSSIIWNTVSLADSTVNIASYMNARGNFAFNNLGENEYAITFNYNGYSTTKSVAVPGNYIAAGFTASSENVVVGETIDFISSTINTTGYVWQFGDSTIETGVANPTYFYYIPGVFTVTLTCTNAAGCSAEAQTVITVTEPTGINNPIAKDISIINLGTKAIQIIINYPVMGDAEIQIYNILGQQVYTNPVTSNQMQISLADQSPGIYLVSVKNGNKSTTTKIYIN